jgi:hypothetical protein
VIAPHRRPTRRRPRLGLPDEQRRRRSSRCRAARCRDRDPCPWCAPCWERACASVGPLPGPLRRGRSVEVTDGEQLSWALEPAAPHIEASLHDDVTVRGDRPTKRFSLLGRSMAGSRPVSRTYRSRCSSAKPLSAQACRADWSPALGDNYADTSGICGAILSLRARADHHCATQCRESSVVVFRAWRSGGLKSSGTSAM